MQVPCLLLLFTFGFCPLILSAQVATDEEVAMERAIGLISAGQIYRAAPLLREIADGSTDAALTASRLLGRYYLDRRDQDSTVLYYRRALRLSGPTTERAAPLDRANYALALQLSQPDSSRQLAEDVLAETEDDKVRLLAYGNLGRLGENAGNLSSALSYTVLMQEILDDGTSLSPLDRYYAYGRMGLIKRAANIYNTDESGLPELKRSLAIALRSGAPMHQLTAYSNLGGGYRQTKEADKELAAYERALAVADKYPEHDLPTNVVLHNLAGTHFRNRRLKEAVAANLRSIPAFRRYDPSHLHFAYLMRGALANATGQPEVALMAIDSAVIALSAGQVDQTEHGVFARLDGITDLKTMPHIYGFRAQALTRMGRTEDAVANYEATIDVRDVLRERATTDEERRLWSDYGGGEFIEPMLDLLYAESRDRPDQVWRAFHVAERARGYSLLAALRRTRILEDAQTTTLREQIARWERTGNNAAELASAQLELAALTERTHSALPAYEAKRVEDTHRLLSDAPHDILEYYVGARTTYLLHVAPGSDPRMYQLTVGDSLTKQVNAFRNLLIGSAYRRKSLRSVQEQDRLDKTLHRVGLALTKTLLPDSIVSTLTAEALIVPHGVLNYLPFAALPLTAGHTPEIDYREQRYLADQSAISYAYSLHHLAEIKQIPEDTYAYDFVGFAPSFRGVLSVEEVYAQLRGAITEGQRGSVVKALPPLQNNYSETTTIGERFTDAQLYVDEDATLETYRNIRGQAKILHLSTHGRVDAEREELSYVAFAQTTDTLDTNQLLYFNDMDGTSLPAELVVLSACETSLGKLAPGEAPLSLASAFATAGARSTLTTLWTVDDAATELFMVRFYKELKNGATRLEALKEAQRYLRTETDYFHPFYWAGFVLHGADGPIDLGTPTPRWYYLLALGAILAVILLLLRARRPAS